ncbi:hypothetical protein AAEY27_18120 [Kosakonia sp. BYX6]|uniref:Uncharacterized protein n=1 Tax=Kosakonia calanthes TaxID=3139408 RepID=A0ABZ3B327_9ENTR
MINGLNFTSLLTSSARVNSSVQVGATARATSNNAASASQSASAKVMFGSQTQQIAAVYSLSPKKIDASLSLQQNAQLQGLMTLASGSGSVSAFAGLGSALLSHLKDNREDVTQALSGAALGVTKASSESAVTLDIVTQSGSTVHLVMTEQDDGMAVELKTEGEALNDDEAAAVANLSGALEKTLRGLGQQPPQLDIAGLTRFDSRMLKSVDLKTDMRNDQGTLQSLNFHADDKTRTVAYEDADFSLKMSSDTANSTLTGNYAQQQSALSAYDDKFDKARIAGHGDRDQMAALKSVFRALNSNADADKKVNTTSKEIRIGDNGASQLSGLNDFSLSLTQTEKAINPARSDEKDRFAYTASQSTEESQRSSGEKVVVQTARSHLSAAWHAALDPSIPLALNTMKSSQNYTYHLLENDEASTTTLDYNGRGQLANVGYHEQVNNRETVKKYVLGKLIENTLTPEQYSRNKRLSLLSSL